MGDALAWVIFFASATVVVAAGTQLARSGDRIAEETGIGGLWIGVLLMATATSLPEVVTDTTAAIIDEPDLAAGDLFGSSMANMMVLAIIDLLHRRHRVWQRVSLGHTLVAGLAMALTAVAAALINADLGWSIGHVGVDTIGVAVLYVAGTRVVFRHEYLEARQRIAEESGAADGGAAGGGAGSGTRLRYPSWRSLVGFGVSAGLILAAAPFVANSASDIADMTGIAESFVGASFLAITTSLPELVTAIAAVRLGAYDLAVGNLFGSNSFNMFVFLFVDVAYTPGPVLSAVADAQVLAALVAVFLMATGMMGIIYRAERRFYLVEPDALAVILGYVLGMWLVFSVSD